MTLAFDSSFDSHRYDFRFLRYPASKGSLIFNSRCSLLLFLPHSSTVTYPNHAHHVRWSVTVTFSSVVTTLHRTHLCFVLCFATSIIASTFRENPGWFRNSAGFWFNSRFGFGLMNAYSLVSASYNWTTVPAKAIFSTCIHTHVEIITRRLFRLLRINFLL